MEFPTNIPTSPTLATDNSIVHSAKEFSDNLSLDLTDSEITEAFRYITSISKKWRQRFIYEFGGISDYSNLNMSRQVEKAAKLIDQFESEIHHTLAEKMDLMVVVDMGPVFEGEPPVVELVGALPTHSSAKYGLDYDKKIYEVKKAVERGEDFYGQKESLNPQTKRKNAIRNENKRKNA